MHIANSGNTETHIRTKKGLKKGSDLLLQYNIESILLHITIQYHHHRYHGNTQALWEKLSAEARGDLPPFNDHK